MNNFRYYRKTSINNKIINSGKKKLLTENPEINEILLTTNSYEEAISSLKKGFYYI